MKVKAGCSSVSSKVEVPMQNFWAGEISLKLGPFLNCELTISYECAIRTVINSLQHYINTCFKTQMLNYTKCNDYMSIYNGCLTQIINKQLTQA